MPRIALALLALALGACSWLPLPTTVDLKARLGNQASGSYRTSVHAGSPQALDALLPEDEGDAVDFSDAGVPVTVEWAELQYNIELSYFGPELSGSLDAELYIAPDNGDNLWQPLYRLGPPVKLDLDHPRVRLTGRAKLNEAQILALNEGRLRYGVQVRGQGIAAESDGAATLQYSVNILKLNVGVAVF